MHLKLPLTAYRIVSKSSLASAAKERESLHARLNDSEQHRRLLTDQLAQSSASQLELCEQIQNLRSDLKRAHRQVKDLTSPDDFLRAGALQSVGALRPAIDSYKRVPNLRERLTVITEDGRSFPGPDFLLIGAPRSGTSWLKMLICHHPEIFVLPGEVHYFSASIRSSVSSYLLRFASPGAKFKRKPMHQKTITRRIYGEKSASYLAMPEDNIELAATLFPQIRVVALIREPILRAWSHIKHLGIAPEAAFTHSKIAEVLAHGRYRKNIARWAKHVHPSQILLIDFDRIAFDASGVLAEVSAHIGASEFPFASELNLGAFRPPAADAPPADVMARLQCEYESEEHRIDVLRTMMHVVADGSYPLPVEESQDILPRSDILHVSRHHDHTH